MLQVIKYNLDTTGKLFNLSLLALLRAVGVDGEAAINAIKGEDLDLSIKLLEPGKTGAYKLTTTEVDGRSYTVSEDELSIKVAKLVPGVSRLVITAKYGSYEEATLMLFMHVQQEVKFFKADGVYTPLVRTASLDATLEGTDYKAYTYPYGDVVLWFAGELVQYGNVNAKVLDGIEGADIENATDEVGRIVVNADVAVYDEEQDIEFTAIDAYGGTGSGDSNLIVGTEAERLAVEEPYNGLEFNQVNYDEETAQYSVTRYIYENGQWVELESPQTESEETVSLHVTTWDGLGNVEGLAVGITDNTTEAVIQRYLDENGNCSFKIVKGHSYTVSVADLTGYHSLPDETFMASMDERSITMTFLAETSNYETVIAHITVYNKNLVDITNSDTDFVGLTVELQVEGEDTPRAGVIDSNHQATFQVEYGKTYSLTAPTVEGYKTRYASSFSHTASVPQRELPLHYMEWVDAGIYGVKADGTYYDYDSIEAMDSTERAELVAIALNTSRLQAANAGFMFKLPNSTVYGYKWAASNVEFDKTLLPFKSNHAAAVLDLDGATNTQKIVDIGDSMSVETPAADWCQAQSLTIGGEAKTGFLGAYGQMYALAENIAVINAIFSLCGYSAPGFTAGYWWSSTQYSETGAVDLINGGFNNYSKAGTGNTTVALFALS